MAVRENAPGSGGEPASGVPPDGRAERIAYHRTWLALAAAILAACLLLPAPGPSGTVDLPLVDASLPTVCMTKRHFQIDCPGCGLTRCFLAISHGRVATAWAWHPVGVVLFACLAAQVPYRLWQLARIRRGRGEFQNRLLAWLPWILLGAMLTQWLLWIE